MEDKYKVIIAGSRNFDDYPLLERSLKEFLKGRRPSEVVIVSGKARGADTLGETFQRNHKCGLKEFPANWNKQSDGSFDRSAGHKRNAEMANYSDACVAFWDGKSPGTKGMIDLAKRKGLDVKIVLY